MDKVWLKNYQPGVPAEIDINQFQSVSEVFARSVERFRDRPAMANMGKVYTYGELDALTVRFASFLQNTLKLPMGARVAVMMPNLLQYPVAVFAILRAGYTVVNVNPLYTPRELEHQLNDAGVDTIVILENFANVLQQVIARTAVKHVVLTRIGDLLGAPKSWLVNFAVKHVKKMVPAWKLPVTPVLFNDALKAGAAQPLTPVSIGHDDVAFLQYTGGTTGVAKGAMLLHRNIVANMLQAGAWVKPAVREGQEVIVTALPLYHIFSLTARWRNSPKQNPGD
jgi:long-chain acyl-CoA synthetase